LLVRSLLGMRKSIAIRYTIELKGGGKHNETNEFADSLLAAASISITDVDHVGELACKNEVKSKRIHKCRSFTRSSKALSIKVGHDKNDAMER
jgi:hypothetical protein